MSADSFVFCENSDCFSITLRNTVKSYVNNNIILDANKYLSTGGKNEDWDGGNVFEDLCELLQFKKHSLNLKS